MKEQVRCVNVCTRLVLSWYRYAQVKICTCTKLMLANQNKPASTRVGTHARRVVRLGRSGKLGKRDKSGVEYSSTLALTQRT